MRITHDLNLCDTYTTFIYDGAFGGTDIQSYWQSVFQTEIDDTPARDALECRVLDFTGIDFRNASRADIERGIEVEAIVTANLRNMGINTRKVAIIADNELQFGLARMYAAQNNRGKTGDIYSVHRSRKGALRRLLAA